MDQLEKSMAGDLHRPCVPAEGADPLGLTGAQVEEKENQNDDDPREDQIPRLEEVAELDPLKGVPASLPTSSDRL
jgi:hypothetical protein